MASRQPAATGTRPAQSGTWAGADRDVSLECHLLVEIR